MKRKWATIYAIACTLLLVAGFSLAFFFAWREGVGSAIACVCGFALSLALSPVVHELGHLFFAHAVGFDCVYIKCFCFKMQVKKGKKRLSLASPFAAEQTQALPRFGGNMPRRAAIYTLGGLLFSGFVLVAILSEALLRSCLTESDFVTWGALPYAAYLFLLNALPLEYAGGKTDTLVYRGIKRGADEEKCMLAAMEIQGQLYEGKSFKEIDEGLYFNLPQLREDEPLYAMLLDLRYRYYLDKEEWEAAADCLNRLALAQGYLPDEQVEQVAAELVYMHALNGDIALAEESGKLCRGFLSGDSVTAKRILAAYSLAAGKAEAVEPLKAQAQVALGYERVAGVRKFEENLLLRIKTK